MRGGQRGTGQALEKGGASTRDRRQGTADQTESDGWAVGLGTGQALGKAEPARETGTKLDNVTGKQEKQNENETRKEQAKNGDRDAQENRDGKQKRGKTRIVEHTPTRDRTEADENKTGDRVRTD
ncbi:hypothetical protein DFP73DRAFT_596150 [Morchella snyderi]|nr:hypothetical protein DFP73DRAFT_596150 [Morchella snyderi]